jgi:hypothetical protein
MATVILEHRFDNRPFDIERFHAAKVRTEPCLALHGARHLMSYVTPDGRRMICVFEAPDCEAVRQAARQLGFRYDAVWSATVVS